MTVRMTRAEYLAKHRDYRGTVDGVPYVLYYEPGTGTVYGPVEIIRRVPEPNVDNVHTSDGEAVNRSVFCRCQRADRATVHFRADRSPIAGRACRFCRCVVRAEEVAS